jgi:hypothetical protein
MCISKEDNRMGITGVRGGKRDHGGHRSKLLRNRQGRLGVWVPWKGRVHVLKEGSVHGSNSLEDYVMRNLRGGLLCS